MSSINLTPTWVAAMEILLTVLEDGTEAGKLSARDELREIARKLDQLTEIRSRGAGSKRPSHSIEDWVKSNLPDLTPAAKPVNRYMAYYRNHSIEVEAETSYQAQRKAAALFRAKREYEVDVMLAEKNGKPVIHSTAELGS